MESLFVLVIIAVIVLVVVVPVSALILAASARRQANEAVRNLVSLSRHVADLQAAVRNLNQQFERRHPPAAESQPPTAGQPAPSPMAVPPAADEPAAAPGPAVPTLLKPVVAPPPLILPSPSGRDA